MKKNEKLSALIYTRYKSESACAKAMGWPRQRLNRITTGEKIPDIAELNLLANALQVPLSQVLDVMTHKDEKLTNLIYMKFKSESACAEAMGWKPEHLKNIISGKEIPDVAEINVMSRALQVSVGYLADIFLP